MLIICSLGYIFVYRLNFDEKTTFYLTSHYKAAFERGGGDGGRGEGGEARGWPL